MCQISEDFVLSNKIIELCVWICLKYQNRANYNASDRYGCVDKNSKNGRSDNAKRG